MNQQELQERINQFIAMLDRDVDVEWFDTDQGVGSTVLTGFLWWMFPELEPSDVPDCDRWPWTESQEVSNG